MTKSFTRSKRYRSPLLVKTVKWMLPFLFFFFVPIIFFIFFVLRVKSFEVLRASAKIELALRRLETADLVIFTAEILCGKVHFCAVLVLPSMWLVSLDLIIYFSMRCISVSEYGGPKVLRILGSMPTPKPNEHQV